MKVLKNVFLVIGLLGIAGAAVTLGITVLVYLPDITRLAAARNMGDANLVDPTSWVLLSSGLAAVGGVLLGLGIGMPPRTANAVRHDTIEELHRQTTADAAVAAAAVTEPADEPHTEPTV